MTLHPEPQLSIIIPTYREAANLGELVREIAATLEGAGIGEWELLVIDDDSQDGSEEVCAGLAAAGLPVRIQVRQGERDLSTAVLQGFALARGSVLLVMDGDLSHPPGAIPELYRAVRAGAEFALGSRYRSGGEIEPRWGWFRHLNSRAASLLTAGLVRLSDPISGFFAFPRSLLGQCPNIYPIGYKIGLEILVKSGAQRVSEIPIHFRHRRHGQSKLTLRQQLHYLRHLRWLYQFKYPRLAELADIGLIGGLGFLFDLGVYLALYKGAGLPHLLARVLSFLPGSGTNWFFHRWTTQIGRRQPAAGKWLPVLLAGGVANLGSYWWLTRSLACFISQPLLALPVSVAAGAVVNYLMYRSFIFRVMDRTFRHPTHTPWKSP